MLLTGGGSGDGWQNPDANHASACAPGTAVCAAISAGTSIGYAQVVLPVLARRKSGLLVPHQKQCRRQSGSS